MKNKEKKGLFADKRVVLVVSVLLAVLAWVVVAGFINPDGERTIPNVQVDYKNREEDYTKHDLIIVSDQSNESNADVVVSGDASVINSLANADVMVYADYSAVTGPGTYDVPLRAEKVASGAYNIIEYSLKNSLYSLRNTSTTVPMTFEQVGTMTYPVKVHDEKVTAAEDFFKDVAEVSQTSVTLSGPTSELSRVAEVAAVLPEEEDLRETLTTTVPLTLLDKNGDEVDAPKLTMSPVHSVEVTVPVLEIRTIGLTADFVGQPAGFDEEWFNSLVGISEESMDVIGSSSAFANLEDPYPVAEFDLSSLSMSWVSDPVNIKLPEGIRSYDSLRQVTVSVDTSSMVEKTLSVDEYRVVNQPKNAQIAPLSGTMNVTLMGDAAQMEAILPENVVIQIDAYGVTAGKSGQQIIPARVLVPSANRVFAVGTYPVVCTVEVEGGAAANSTAG